MDKWTDGQKRLMWMVEVISEDEYSQMNEERMEIYIQQKLHYDSPWL